MVFKKRFDLGPMLKPKSVAIIGASRDQRKVGHVILQNYIDAGYTGKLYPVNKSGEQILGMTTYTSVMKIGSEIDLAVIAVPAQVVPLVLEECGRAKVKSVVVVSGGFAEIGNVQLQERIARIAEKYRIPMLGPNCLGVMDPRSRIDTLFLPTYKLSRPRIGGVSFVSQSGAVGSTILDLISKEGFGLSKFISYGNAAYIDEADILEYLMKDKDTKVIIMYIEGVKRGKEFIEIAKEVTKRKPVIVLKGGVTSEGAVAAHSHTAALAGSNEAYEALFRQFGFVVANDLNDLLYFAKAFDSEPMPKGDRVAVITNGGGAGVLTTDRIYLNGLRLAGFSENTKKIFKNSFSSIVNIKNPLDMAGDANDKSYETALSAISKDGNVDMIIAIALFQTPGADSKVAATLARYKEELNIPMVVISVGSDYTQVHKAEMESSGLPVYDSPTSAVLSLRKLLDYARYLNKK